MVSGERQSGLHETHASRISAHDHGFIVKIAQDVFFSKSFHRAGWGDVVRMANSVRFCPVRRSELLSVVLSASTNAQRSGLKIFLVSFPGHSKTPPCTNKYHSPSKYHKNGLRSPR